jgi:2-dehydro-3-deoxyphosphogluconate aldolase/(4S)-4-hydroxy-2-oxoglutarate aldolase
MDEFASQPKSQSLFVRQSWVKRVQQHRAIAVIRAAEFALGQRMAQAVAAGGMRLIEITWNSDRALALVERLRQDLPNCTIGMGTLLELSAVQQAIAAGAEFLFTPHTDASLIQAALAQGVPMVSGALSPTEIVAAWQSGAASVKVFPVQAMGGTSYIQSLQAPMGEIPLIPTGGVTTENAKAFLTAGAIGVGLSGQLFPAAAIEQGNWQVTTQRAQRLMQDLGVSSLQTADSYPAHRLP